LTLTAMFAIAAGALGLINLQVPAQVSSAVSLGLETLPWLRVGLAIVLVGWVVSRWASDAE
jgi:hypothetical protein